MLALAAGGGLLLAYGAHRHQPAAAPLPTALFNNAAPAKGANVQPVGRAPGQATGDPAKPTTPVVGLGPDRVVVPSLGVDAGWVSEPITASSLQIPADVHTIGLAAAGAQPGDPAGTVVLASHVNYAGQGAGSLAPLYRIGPGALVILTDAHARASRWRVTSLADPLKADLDAGLFTTAGPPRLALITCGGPVSRGEYARNIVATAIPETTWERS